MRAGRQLRRVPAQARSRERLERILDASEAELASVGYEAATMQSIADRAETSIGSVYQFFPNKEAVFEAIARRYLDQVRALFDALYTPELLERPLTELVDQGIDAFWRFITEAPGFRAVWIQGSLSPAILEAGLSLNRELARRVETILTAKLRRVSKPRRALVATVVVESTSAMLIIAGRGGGPDGARLVRETKLLVRRYLEPHAR